MRKENKKQSSYIIIFLCTFLFVSQTIAYAALSTTVNIDGNAYARVEANVRITEFILSEVSENSISAYEEFSKNTISANITLPTSESYIIYKVEVTNYGTTATGIKEITGLQSELTYELIDYNLKDKICDTNNNCGSLSTKIFYIKISGTAGQYDIQLNFNFQNFYSITYKNLSNDSYPLEILGGETLSLDVSTSIMNKFYAENDLGGITPTLSSNVLTISNITGNTIVTGQQETMFSYTGDYQTFTVPATAIYKVELWGAGGSTCGTVSYGAYTKGEITFSKDTDVYLYLGGKGARIDAVGSMEGTEGYNGGGQASNTGYSTGLTRCGGAGATDIRLTSGVWNNFESLKSRIMVAAGSGSYSQTIGGAGGGLIGYQCEERYSSAGELTSPIAYGGTQTAGGLGSYSSAFKGYGENGGFGYGGAGYHYASGGGGGYYGGAGGARNTVDSGGGGGSSFISGHNGCIAITEESTEETITHKSDSTGTTCIDGTTDITCSYHYSGYIFENTTMIDGMGYNWTTEVGTTVVKMPSPTNSSSLITGNNGNGYAKITLIELKEE